MLMEVKKAKKIILALSNSCVDLISNYLYSLLECYMVDYFVIR